jgi:adenylyltransferase/sulfurtransferase
MPKPMPGISRRRWPWAGFGSFSGAALRSRTVFIDAGNARALLEDHDLVVEGVDDLHAKQLVDRTCGDLQIPLVSGGVYQQQGQVIVLHAAGDRPELSRGDLFTGKAGMEQDGCDMRDVPLELLEEVGAAMAGRAKALLRGEPLVNGRIDLFDLVRRQWMSIGPPTS